MANHGRNSGSRAGRASQQLQESQANEACQARGAGPTLVPVLAPETSIGSDQLD